MDFLNGLLAGAEKLEGDALTGAMETINSVINIVVAGLGGIMILLAIYLAYKFMTADTDDKRKNAKAQMIYAIVGVVVVFVVLILWNSILKPALVDGNAPTGEAAFVLSILGR